MQGPNHVSSYIWAIYVSPDDSANSLDHHPTVTDEAPLAEHEIVMGHTNRATLADLPPKLKPAVPEGFVILRQDEKLLILSNIPRATLYGVYELLELELGCRFLSAELTHVPRRETVRRAGQRFIDVTTELKMTHFSEFYGKPGEQFEEEIYPRIRSVIDRRQFIPSSAAAPGTVRTHVGTRGATKWCRPVEDSSAETGLCLQQDDGTKYTWDLVSMDWSIRKHLATAAQKGKRYRLRARIKVKKAGDEGNAVKLGINC